ncbi:MAG: flagellar basal body protein FliL [Candidatus Liberibacter europaeus]|uniref:Flagellar protein FliL n=1 Tax=Candidatus Liberibacter europaeus TaxID=744859 RepID=A0A2T4VXP2_9HYPH|nr:flagellar basal body protein FliL [Candidatus Liberibacter europaeus]PTL86538.1 MAG: flagellar basal body protein FliL [Candidatus Liberibacter europaeus]
MSDDAAIQKYFNANRYYQVFITKFILLTCTGIFCGWLGGFEIISLLSDKEKNGVIISLLSSMRNNQNSSVSTDMGEIAQDKSHIIPLKPIITNFGATPEHMIRLDIALICKNIPDKVLLEMIHQDIIAYFRTISIEQITGPQGFRYLKNDVEEHINLRSKNLVSQVIFRTFIIT